MSNKDWKVYGVCPECGYTKVAPMGDIWFLEKRFVCCPTCGTPVKNWKKKVGRRVILEKGKHFWSRNRWGWEWR